MKVLIIGNSFIGAMKAAIGNENLTDEFSFIGKGGNGFGLIDCNKSGVLKNYKFSDGGIKKLKHYDFIFIYADMLSPTIIDYNLSQGKFSQSVVEQTVKDSIKDSDTYKLANRIFLKTGIKSILIPSNYECIWQGKVKSTIDAFDKVNKYSDFTVLSACDGIYDINGKPDINYFKDSAYINGSISAKESHPEHDVYHMNKKAGAVILKNISHYVSHFAADQTPSI